MFSLHSPRLQLIPLHLSHLYLLKQDRVKMEQALGLLPSNMQTAHWIIPEIEEAIDFWIECVENDPTNYLWHTNWEIVLTEENRSIGNTGFSGIPDEQGETLVGYSIDLNYHNQGYMTEALNELINWAKKNPKLKRILAETPRLNYSSHRVLLKNEFKQLDTHEESGLILWGRWMHRKRFLLF